MKSTLKEVKISTMNIYTLLCIIISILITIIIFLLFKGEKKGLANKSRRVKKPATEFSKKILIASYSIAILVIIYTMYIIYLMVIGEYMGDPSSLNTLVALTIGEMTMANSFYFWKSRLENKIKLENQYGIKIEDNLEEDII